MKDSYDDEFFSDEATKLPGATIAAVDGVKDSVADLDNGLLVNEESDFFITSRAKISDSEIRRRREEEEKKKLRQQKKEENFQTQFALRKRNMSQGAALELKKGHKIQIQEELKQKRIDFEDMEQKWKQREEALKQQKLDFMRRIESQRHFEKQNQSQYQKYSKKAEDEAKQNVIKQTQRDDLQKEIENLKSEKDQLERQLKNVMQYHAYLESICKVEASFDEIDKICKRYDTLIYANTKLKSEIESNKSETKNLNSKFKAEKEERQNKIFELNTLLVEQRKELDQTAKERKAKEDQLSQMDNNTTKTERLIGEIEMSIRNLSIRCDSSRKYKVGKKKRVEDLDTPQQLDVIAYRLKDLIEIVKNKDQTDLR